MSTSNMDDGSGYELRFYDLLRTGRAYAFPCDAQGRVNMDTLSERARDNYFYARALVGRETSVPSLLKVCH